MSFDIVIPVGSNDVNILEEQLKYTKKNIIGYRKIYIITNSISGISDTECQIIDESIFPFTKHDVEIIHGENVRNGWYLQQLLKLYCSFVIPDILETYLVVDCDTFFLKPTSFIESCKDSTVDNSLPEDKYLFNIDDEYNPSYFEHMKRLHISLERMNMGISGITHHMIFNKEYVNELFQMVEKEHNGTAFWRVFLEKVEKSQTTFSGASEYEIYFNYMLKYHPDKIKIRNLKRANNGRLIHIQRIINENYDYMNVHWYNIKGKSSNKMSMNQLLQSSVENTKINDISIVSPLVSQQKQSVKPKGLKQLSLSNVELSPVKDIIIPIQKNTYVKKVKMNKLLW